MCNKNQMTISADIEYFITGGNATFTLVSVASENRITFKMSRTKFERPSFYVSHLTGADNENDYTYLGMVFDNTGLKGEQSLQFALTKASPQGTVQAKAFNWFLKQLQANNTLTEALEFWHEGKCGVCGRKLTNPESIASGIGPVCATRVG